jgi:hypothetical protein
MLEPRTRIAPTGDVAADVLGAHTHSIDHRDQILASRCCGCFYCLETFPPEAITEWTDRVDGLGVTARCPHCRIDSVIGSASGYTVERWFLAKMREHWFGTG